MQKKCTGISVSIGAGKTKTLAKAANNYAKKTKTKLFDLVNCGNYSEILKKTGIDKVWGIGNAYAKKLYELGIHNALELRNSDISSVRRKFNIEVERTVRELKEEVCIEIEKKTSQKSITVSKEISSYEDLSSILSHFCEVASFKLRKEKIKASGLMVFIETSKYKNNIPYANKAAASFEVPTNDSTSVIENAIKLLHTIHRACYGYKRLGVLLIDLMPELFTEDSLFNVNTARRRNKLMKSLDSLNSKFGQRNVENWIKLYENTC